VERYKIFCRPDNAELIEKHLLKLSQDIWYPYGWVFTIDKSIPKWDISRGLNHRFFEYDENDFTWLRWKGVIKETPKRVYFITQVSKHFRRYIGDLYL